MAEMAVFLRDNSEAYGPASQRVSQTTFLAVSWFFTAFSALFLIARLCIRIHAFRKLALDDLLVILAWCQILIFAISWQIKIPTLYWQFDIVTGKQPVTPDFLPAYNTFLPWVVGWNVLFYCCLWSVKFSFLVFFRGLGSRVNAHRTWWWIVFVFTCAGLIVSIADIDYRCSINNIIYTTTQCIKRDRIHFDNATLFANMAIDIFTDVLILSIPITILWKVQIKLKKKLILFGIFSATIIVIIVAIIRASLVNPRKKQTASIDWLYLWSIVEMGVAITIANVASFRQLFISQSNQHLYGRRSSSPSRWNLLTPLRRVVRHESRTNSKDGGPQETWE